MSRSCHAAISAFRGRYRLRALRQSRTDRLVITLYSSPFWQVLREGEVLRIVRSSASFDSIEAMEAEMMRLNARLDSLGRRFYSALVDTRKATGRNDARFEAAFAPHRKRLSSGFRRCGVLVRSAVGKLQVNRNAQTDGVDIQGFTDEVEAVAWLQITTS